MAHLHRAAQLAIVGLAASGVPPLAAQEDLAQRILAAASAHSYWDAELVKVADTVPIPVFLDAVAALRPQLHDYLLARIASLLDARSEAVRAVWHREPDKRRARAAAFGAVSLDWLGIYRDALPAEQREIEAVARWIHPWEDGLRERLGGTGPELRMLRTAAAALLRETARGECERGEAVRARLRCMQADESQRTEIGYLVREGSVSPFVLGPLFADPDVRVHVRAACMLRRSLHLEVPRHLQVLLAEDPLQVAPLWTPGPEVTDAQIQTWIDAIRVGQRPPDASYTPGLGGTPAMHRRLAKVLLDQALVAPPVAAVLDRELASWRSGCAISALQLDSTNAVRLLADGANAVDPGRALVALQCAATFVRTVPPDVARKMAPLVAAFLDYDDARVRAFAASLAAVVLAADPNGPLRDRVVQHTSRVAKAGLGALALQCGRMGGFCGSGPEPLGEPDGVDAALVLAAASAGEPGLATPLVDALVAVQGAPDRAARYLHELFVLRCLQELAPTMPAAAADRVWQSFAKSGRVAWAAWDKADWHSAATPLEFGITSGLLASVSDPTFQAMLATISPALGKNPLLLQRAARFPVPRLRVLLERTDTGCSEVHWLHRHCPEVLAAAWQAGSPRAEQATAALCTISDWPWVVQQCEAGVLPVGLVVKALEGRLASFAPPLPLSVLPLALLARLVDDSDFLAAAPRWLAAVPFAASDLDAWRQLADVKASQVALAAVRRLPEFGNDGRAAASAALQRLLASDDLAVMREAWWTAVDLGLPAGDRATLERRLAAHADPVSQARLRTIAMRLDAWPPRDLPVDGAAQVIAESGVDVTPEQLAQVLRSPTSFDLRLLLGSRSPVTQATALVTAASDPWWEEWLEPAIMARTTHADPRIRAAAFRALGQRDRDVWPSAMLVHEAAFDPDPLVREVAPRLR